jgi:hypothetical protein
VLIANIAAQRQAQPGRDGFLLRLPVRQLEKGDARLRVSMCRMRILDKPWLQLYPAVGPLAQIGGIGLVSDIGPTGRDDMFAIAVAPLDKLPLRAAGIDDKDT